MCKRGTVGCPDDLLAQWLKISIGYGPRSNAVNVEEGITGAARIFWPPYLLELGVAVVLFKIRRDNGK